MSDAERWNQPLGEIYSDLTPEQRECLIEMSRRYHVDEFQYELGEFGGYSVLTFFAECMATQLDVSNEPDVPASELPPEISPQTYREAGKIFNADLANTFTERLNLFLGLAENPELHAEIALRRESLKEAITPKPKIDSGYWH